MPVRQFIYTALPIGKGYNPSLSGYQVKACSDFLSTEQREWLSGLCMHYGDTVYRAAPQEAIDLETAWRVKTDDPRLFPADVLEVFPRVISYCQVDADHFALTSVRYTGLTYDNRPGNFLAYSLLFKPDELQNFQNNALLAARNGILDNPPDTDQIHLLDLPRLERQANSSGATTSINILCESPYSDHLAQLISAIFHTNPDRSVQSSGKPVVLNILNWRQGPMLLEALLSILPSDLRRQTSFCTYESDRNWLPSVRGQRPAGLSAAHQIMILGGRDFKASGLRPDEIQNRFVVFNFANEQFSPIQPDGFALWAANCILQGNSDCLEVFYLFLENLGFSKQPESWDSLLPAFEMDQSAEPEKIAKTLDIFAKLAINNKTAAPALKWLEERQVKWSEKGNATSLSASKFASDMLVNTLPADDPLLRAYSQHLQQLAEEYLMKGQARQATALLQLTGGQRPTCLLRFLKQTLVEKSISKPEFDSLAEKEAWLDLLLEGMAAEEAHPDQSLPMPVILPVIFRTAQEIGRGADIWGLLGNSSVLPYLKGDLDTQKQSMILGIMRTFDSSDGSVASEGTTTLGLRLLNQPGLDRETWNRGLQSVALACTHTPQPEVVIEKLVEAVEARKLSPEEKALALALLLENTPAVRGREKVARGYENALVELKPNQRNVVRRDIAKTGGWSILSNEFIKEMLSQEDDEKKKIYQQWRDTIFNPYPDALEQVYIDLAARLKIQDEQSEKFQALAIDLVSKETQKPLKPGLKILYEMLIDRMSLIPSVDGKAFPFQIPSGLSEHAAQRGRILAFLATIQQQSLLEDWSLEKFPPDQSAWTQDVRSLPGNEKKEVVSWVLRSFQTSGITRHEQARALTRLLKGCDLVNALGSACAGLLQGRDAVSWTLAGAAFMDYGTRFPTAEEGAAVVSLALASFEKNHLHLLEDYIWKRFGKPDVKTREKMADICRLTGLAYPKASVEKKFEVKQEARSEANLREDVQKKTEKPAGTETSGVRQALDKSTKEKSTSVLNKIGSLFQSSESKKSPKETKK